MKVLFLDIDGVLNVQSVTYYSHSWKVLGHDPIEPHLMTRLEFIMERVPDSVIVVTSSWGMKKLIRKLTKARFKYLDRIVDSTPRDVQPRANQIQAWMDENKLGRYIIIEDELGLEREVFPSHTLIDVDMDEGLSNKNTIDSVIALNDLTKYDGIVCELNMTNYKKYHNMGYRAQVGIPMLDGYIHYKELYENWNTITICNRRLEMVLSKEG